MSVLILTHPPPTSIFASATIIPPTAIMIGEAATAFLFILVGIFSQLPYTLASIVFVFNGLPRTRIANSTLFYAIYALGLATASITSIGTAFALIAGIEAATANAFWITTVTFFLLRIVTLSLWPLTVDRMPLSTRNGNVMIPVNTNTSIVLVVLSLAFHIVEFSLMAYLPPGTGRVGLIVWAPFYLYIAGLVIHVFHAVALIYRVKFSNS